VCREIFRKTVLGGIRKELKGVHKKVCPPFPIHIGTYSLLDFGHAKEEAATLTEMRLVGIKFKKHDPHKIVGNHLASCGLKRYEHEIAPHDEVFRGLKTYLEVLNWVRALQSGDMFNFYKFQEHQRSGIPEFLQGTVSKPLGSQQAEAEGPIGTGPNE
jgi:hypothetical protein